MRAGKESEERIERTAPALPQGQEPPVPTARLEKLWVHRTLGRVKGVLPRGAGDQLYTKTNPGFT